MEDTKNIAGELLVELEEKGVTFEVAGEKLKYKDSEGNFSANCKEKVKIYKNEIIEILTQSSKLEEFRIDKEFGIMEYPLTDVQAAYLIGKTEAVEWGGVGCKGYIEVNFGTHSVEELSSAWDILVNRHEMLRAKVRETGFELIEKNEIKYEIEVIDMLKMSKKEKTITLSMLRKEFNGFVFDTENPPLFKVAITKREEGNFFHLLIDLIVSDFASVQLLVFEMGQIMKGIPLKKVETKFSDYILFNQNRKGSLGWYRDRSYWLKRLDKLPKMPLLPRDGRAADVCGFSNEFYRFQKHFDKPTWEKIKDISGIYGVTVSAVLISVYAEVIARWSANKQFTLNLPIQNRSNVVNDIDSIVGDFTAVNLLAIDMTQSVCFIERVKRITGQLLDDLEHNSFSGVEVLRELSKVSEKNETLMPIVFTGVLKSQNDIGTIEYGFSHTPQVWIDCQVVDETDSADIAKGLMVSWDARKGAIKESIVAEMFETFIETIQLLEKKNKEDWEQELEIVVPNIEKKLIFCEQMKEVVKYPYIQQGFIEYARKNPMKIAVVDAMEKMTYGELLEKAEYIAGYLKKEFVGDNRGLVAIRMKKSAKQIAAVMGTLIAGFSYLPIDVKQPLARQDKILTKAKVITELDENIVNDILRNSACRLEEYPVHNNSIAYVIFTSGSTGEPKGVEMSHVAVQNTLAAIKNMYNITEFDTVLGIAELSFDLSVFDIFGVLGVGGTLVLPNPEKGPDASHWGSLITDYKVTLWNTVPAQAEMLDAFVSEERYPFLRLVMLSGDWISTSLPNRLRRTMPSAKIISLGGATEGGIWSIFHEISMNEEKPTILYGKALPGQWIGIVDEELRICPQYAFGQIVIGGYSLAEGYLDDKELTERKFVYLDGEKSRIYLTGDSGRYVENDEIEFLGRMDNQVKINGHRIEIAEIERVLIEMPHVKDCCVVYYKGEAKGKLVAFVKEKEDGLQTALNKVRLEGCKLSTNTIEQFNKVLERAVCITVYEKLSGVFSDKLSLNREELISIIGVLPQYEELLNRWLELLITQGYLQEKNGKYELRGEKSNAEKYWKELQNIPYTDIAPSVVSRYIQNHAENICELFRGEVNPLIFLFPEGRTEIAEALYGDTAIAKLLNGIIADLVSEYAKSFEQISILEVGGGIGATTKQILKKLEGLDYEYLFTDVSNFFLNNLKMKYPVVKTELLNLDEWEISKFGKFHVIIAAGVLNNTKNISETIGKLKHMLEDEGLLLITEPVEEHIEITVSQAFMMPKHSDVRNTTSHCFLNEDEWNDVFNGAGLEIVQTFPKENDCYAKFKQKLFIVRKKIDYKEFLKSMLPTVMIPEKFISIDEIPLSSNGKVNRKALINILEENTFSEVFVSDDKKDFKNEIHSEFEKKIIDIMANVSGNHNISFEDNLLEKGFDSLLLSQAAGKIVNEIPEAKGLRFDEILRVALATPIITEIVKYIEEKRNSNEQRMKKESNNISLEKLTVHKIVYVLGREKDKWGDALEQVLTDADILVKKIEDERLKMEIIEDVEIRNKYLFISQDNISRILAEISELLAQGTIIQKVFMLNPERASGNDFYLGDVGILNSTQSVIDSWKAAVLGEVKTYEINSDEISSVIRKELIDER